MANDNKSPTEAKNDKSALRIPLALIRADYDWNVRHPSWRDDKPEETKNVKSADDDGDLGFAGLMQSIALHGQDTPVVVRASAKSTKYPYELVAGFRRFEALTRLAKQGTLVPGWDDSKNPTVLAQVKVLDDKAARAMNVRENADRENLSTADIATAIYDLQKTYKMADAEVAQIVGVSDGYASKLLRIVEGTDKKVLEHWRTLPKNGDPLGIRGREQLAKLARADQLREYEALLAGKVKGGKGANNDWLTKSIKDARAIGFLIGSLEAADLIHTDKLDFALHVRNLTAGNFLKVHGKADSGATDLQWKALADAAEEGWQAAMAPPEADEADEADGPAPSAAAPAPATSAAS